MQIIATVNVNHPRMGDFNRRCIDDNNYKKTDLKVNKKLIKEKTNAKRV